MKQGLNGEALRCIIDRRAHDENMGKCDAAGAK